MGFRLFKQNSEMRWWIPRSMVLKLYVYLKPPLGYLIYLHINDYLLIMPPRGLMVVMAVVVIAIWRSTLLWLLTFALKTLLCDSPIANRERGYRRALFLKEVKLVISFNFICRYGGRYLP